MNGLNRDYGLGDGGQDWFSSVTAMMDAHPELYPTYVEAGEQLESQRSGMTGIEIAQWRYDNRFPFPLDPSRRATNRIKSRPVADRPHPATVRAWARANGYEVPDKGPLRHVLIDAYRKDARG